MLPMSAVRSNTKNSKINAPQPLFLVSCPVEEPTAYHLSLRLEVMEKATKTPNHSLVQIGHKNQLTNSAKSLADVLKAKKQSIRVKVKMKFARVDHWGCCHQKDLQFIVKYVSNMTQVKHQISTLREGHQAVKLWQHFQTSTFPKKNNKESLSQCLPYRGTDLKPMPFAPIKRFSRARLVDLSISQMATTFFSYCFR